MWYPVTIEEKGNVSWVDNATQSTSYIKRAFTPSDVKPMWRGTIYISPLGIGNKDCIITDINSLIHDLETKPLYLDIFGT